jgi:hypothetical protein
VLRLATQQIVKSYVGGNRFWAACWLLKCGVSDLAPEDLEGGFAEVANEKAYGHKAYMLSGVLARKPLVSVSNRRSGLASWFG